jgi:DNA-binding HxlR family transcriptional regulator
MYRLLGDGNDNSPNGSLRSTFSANPTSPSRKNVRKMTLNLIQFFGRRRRNLSVSFVSDFPTEVHYTLARSDYTRKEGGQCWTSERDFQSTLDKISYKMEKNAQRNNNDRFCRRGLEEHFDEQAKALCVWHRREARHAVWEAQARQRRANVIANAYREITQRCLKLGLKKAEQDAIAARRYLSARPTRARKIATRRRKPQEQQHQTTSKTSSSSPSNRRHAHLE